MTSKHNRASFSSSSTALLALPYSIKSGDSVNFDLTTANQGAYTVADPSYLSSQLKSAEWLHRYGLKSQKLTFDQILQQIGFKRVESYSTSVGKTIGAKYAGNLYQEVQNDNGDRYVLTCRPEKLREFRNRLDRLLNLLQKRLTFITSGSRRLFGIIGEPSVCLVCDCKTTDHRIFNQFQLAIVSLLREQISKIKRFNIIWVGIDSVQYQDKPIDSTSTSIDEAIDWINNRKQTRAKISISATCEAILKAFTNTVHSIYLITEGTSSDSAREMLRDNIVKTRLASTSPIPLHVVSLFCSNKDTEIFLHSIAQTADGTYYSYKIQSELTNYQSTTNLINPTKIKLQENKVQFGSTNLEQANDISLMYKEMNQCRNIIDRLENILGLVKDERQSLDVCHSDKQVTKSEPNLQRSLVIKSSALFNNDENDMASIDWLKIYGVKAQKLDFYTIIQPAAFRHCDGIVTLHQSPEQSNTKQTPPAISNEKLINAKYCDQFAHVTWSDGTIRHVYVTPELHRDYERRIRALIEKIKARLSWLKKGSRDVFGTILEKNIYILIDTSKSMDNHLEFVKDKLRLLIQDQLFSKEHVNMASFNTIVNPWRDRLTKIHSSSTQDQLHQWIDTLHADGSTNTLAALRFALADSGTEAIYLLTDGRPDQNERHILSQVQYRQVIPIHTIAFNIQDQTANQFLFDLAKQTGGRFHAFNYGLESSSIEIPESEDISYLKNEVIYAEKELQRVADLRDECMGRTWSQDNLPSKPRISLSNEYLTRSHSTLEFHSSSNNFSMPKQNERKHRPSASLHRRSTIEPTSLLNLNPDQWLLPETEKYLKTNRKHLKSSSTIDNEETEPVKLPPTLKTVSTPYDEVKSYLKKNSLISRGLTIFDVLQPTSITIKEPQHIQVIDRYVLSKVWNDILPLAYGSYANKLRLVNQYAVNLDRYETKLKDLIQDYYQFTSKFIWKHINDEEKRRLIPRLYWISLSNEEQNKFTREITNDEYTDQTALELFAWRKLTNDEQEIFLRKPVLYQDKTEILLKNALKTNETDSTLDGVNRMDVEIQRAIKFLQISADLRQYQKRTESHSNESKVSLRSKTPPKRPSTSIRKFGQRVLCRYDLDGYYYPGTIQKDENNQTILLFDMDIQQSIVNHVLIPLYRNQLLNLFLQDTVLVRQENESNEYWIPGVIVCLPSPYVLPANLYKIYAFDTRERQVYAHRKDLIRISLTLYQRSIAYLKNISRNMPSMDGFNLPEKVDSPTPFKNEIEKLIQELLKPITERVENLTETNNERFNELEQNLRDLISATRILQEKRSQPKKKKNEGTQIDDLPSLKPIITPDRSSKVLAKGTLVLARWKDDDGLFYKGTILESIDDSQTYQVERIDLPDVCSTISLDDLFEESQSTRLEQLNNQSKQFILIEYPNDTRQCFCPAVIISSTQQTKVQIRFYDCEMRTFSNQTKVYLINESQFQEYTIVRIEKEKSLVNQIIVGFNETAKHFMLGTIIQRIDTGQTYDIEWYDKTRGKQNEEHLFGAFVRRDQHHLGDYVLAIDKDDQLYKFAKIKSISNDEKTLQIQYLPPHPSKIAEVPSVTTFVVTKTYYNSMRNVLQS